ncbi:MAG: methylmalonyl-CoA mutase subunit beta [Acidimicrobiia bacterium]|nr:methylmalonyl-CoA mutase subunit beta [Acidimicrobiia bacterium]
MSETPLRPGGEFPPADHVEWVALAEKSLRGKPLASLATTTLDDLTIAPLYTAADVVDRPATGLPGMAPHVRGSRAAAGAVAGWDVRQHFAHPDPAVQNDAVLAALLGGVTSVWLRVDDADDLDRMLEGVLFDLAPVALDAAAATASAARALVAAWQQSGVAAADIGGSFRADPIGVLARHGALAASLDRSFDETAELVGLSATYPQVRALAVDATPYADAGASDADELACSLAAAAAVLRELEARGIDPGRTCDEIEFTYSATADQFATIAKLRAARRLWSRVTDACGLGPRPQVQHAVSSAAMLSRRDPWVNLLRVTIASFAAGVAGADMVTATPFDAAIGVSDEFGHRMARNTQALLIEESNLHRLIDPAGGSWYVESLTDELARAAWRRFQQIESAGGIVEQLRSGDLAADLERTWQRRLDALSTRRSTLTGVSEFPALDETLVSRPTSVPRPAVSGGETVAALPLRRFPAPFEVLRDAADAADEPPVIFCANLGPLRTHTTRTAWATNAFAVGGIRALADGSYDDAASAAAAFTASGARLVVICSSDEVYDEQAEAVANALVGAGAERVYLAGDPGEHSARYEAAGVDEFVYTGVDVLDALRRAHEVLGLEAA